MAEGLQPGGAEVTSHENCPYHFVHCPFIGGSRRYQCRYASEDIANSPLRIGALHVPTLVYVSESSRGERIEKLLEGLKNHDSADFLSMRRARVLESEATSAAVLGEAYEFLSRQTSITRSLTQHAPAPLMVSPADREVRIEDTVVDAMANPAILVQKAAAEDQQAIAKIQEGWSSAYGGPIPTVREGDDELAARNVETLLLVGDYRDNELRRLLLHNAARTVAKYLSDARTSDSGRELSVLYVFDDTWRGHSVNVVHVASTSDAGPELPPMCLGRDAPVGYVVYDHRQQVVDAGFFSRDWTRMVSARGGVPIATAAVARNGVPATANR